MKDKLTMLMILDGFGNNKNKEGNAIKLAKTPNIDRMMKKYPTVDISTSGLAVGLPEGQMGNSEVGHTNIGAGRIVYQELTRITKSAFKLAPPTKAPSMSLIDIKAFTLPALTLPP